MVFLSHQLQGRKHKKNLFEKHLYDDSDIASGNLKQKQALNALGAFSNAAFISSFNDFMGGHQGDFVNNFLFSDHRNLQKQLPEKFLIRDSAGEINQVILQEVTMQENKTDRKIPQYQTAPVK